MGIIVPIIWVAGLNALTMQKPMSIVQCIDIADGMKIENNLNKKDTFLTIDCCIRVRWYSNYI
jgi:hypothetical protein